MKNTKYQILGGIIVIVLIVMAGYSSMNSNGNKILAVLPLSGTSAQHGIWMQRGIELALEDRHSDVELILEDVQLDPKSTIAVFNKYQSVKNIKAAFTLGTPVAMAAGPIANKSKLPLFAIATAKAYSSPSDYTYRINGPVEVEVAAIKNTLDSQGYQKVIVAYLDNDYGKSLLQEINSQFDKGKIVGQEGFVAGSSDYRAQAMKIKKLDADVIFVAAWGTDSGVIIKQLRSMGITLPIYCGSAGDNPDLIKAAGSSAEGVKIISPTTEVNDQFKEVYTARYHEPMNFITMRAYDAINIVLDAIEKCESSKDSGDCVNNYVSGLKDHKGIGQVVNFNSMGDLIDTYKESVIKDGVIVK